MEKTKGLNSNQLKFIAILTMTVDHVISVMYPDYPKIWWVLLLHIIGRFTAPTMWFFIAEGYHYTHNLKKYMGRLFLFAFISHFAYNFAFGIPMIPFQTSIFNQTSVIWSLAWGVVALFIADCPKIKGWLKPILIFLICVITFCSDWSCIAVLAILGIGSHRGDFKRQMLDMVIYTAMYALVYFLFIDKVYGILQMGVVIVIPFLAKYNGQRGNWKGMKWFFYLYYPLHLTIVGLLRLYFQGNVGVMIGG